MPRILLFLGAGASKPFGVPTMLDMVTGLRRYLKEHTIHGADLYDEILGIVKKSARGRLDLEKILDVIHDLASGGTTVQALGLLAPHAAYRVRRLMAESGRSVSNSLDRLDTEIRRSAKECAELEAASIEYIRRCCSAARRGDAAEAYRTLLEGLAAADLRNAEGVGIGEGKVGLPTGSTIQMAEIATTNYDGCFEAFSSKYRISFESGFEYSGAEHEHYFNYERLFVPRAWPFLKLHGSVDWWRAADNRVVEFAAGAPGLPLRSGIELREPEIRYPVSLKDIIGDPYLHIYARFARSLMDCDIWIFIGYAFGDASVRQLILGSIRKATRIVVVTPHAPDLVETIFPAEMPGIRVPVAGEFPKPDCLQALADAAH